MNDPNNSIVFDTANNNASASIAAGVMIGAPRNLSGHQPYALIPDGAKMEPIPRLDERERPEHTVAHPRFHDAPSFIAYVKRFATKDTVIFADSIAEQPVVVAILDYHEPGETAGDSKARFTSHRATFVPQLSAEWETWREKDTEVMDQVEFAKFIEDNLPDIQVPSGAEVLEMALTMEAKSEHYFKSSIRVQDGAQKLSFSEDVNAKAGNDGQITIPKEIKLLLRPFLSSAGIEVKARLRFRPAGGKVTFWYELWRADQVLIDAFATLTEFIGETIELDVLAGIPVHKD